MKQFIFIFVKLSRTIIQKKTQHPLDIFFNLSVFFRSPLTKFTVSTFLISVTTTLCSKKVLSCKHAVKLPRSTMPTSRVGVWFFNQVHVVASRCIFVCMLPLSILWLLQIFHWILCGISNCKSRVHPCILHDRINLCVSLVHHCIYRSIRPRNCRRSLKCHIR